MIIVLASFMQVRQVVETLRCCAHQAFPVTPEVRRAYDSAEPFDLHGVILRSTLLRLLQYRVGLFALEPGGDVPPARSHIPSTQRVGPIADAGVAAPQTLLWLQAPCSSCARPCRLGRIIVVQMARSCTPCTPTHC